jgi:ferritin-like protein
VTSPAVIDLLGSLAYGELVSYERITADAVIAPTLADQVELAAIAAVEYSHFQKIATRLQELGADPVVVMQPFVEPINQLHENLAPRDWLEGLLKVYVGDGIVADFYRELSAQMAPDIAELIEEVLGDSGHDDFAISRIQQAIAQDGKVAGRLALWGRRLMGEMISQATLVSAARPELHTLFLDAARDADNMSGLLNRLTVGHARRMDVLKLAS